MPRVGVIESWYVSYLRSVPPDWTKLGSRGEITCGIVGIDAPYFLDGESM
jgi:hypothetical protein